MGKSSKDKRDLYYRKAKEEGWRARSAFKLLQLDSQFHLLNHGPGGKPLTRVVDLCAAPGSWSQVLSKTMYGEYNRRSEIYDQYMAEYARLVSDDDEEHTKKSIEEELKQKYEVTEKPEEPKIVSVDLQPIAPIPGIITLQADITHPKTISRILELFGGKPADLVISDGAPDVTGLHDLDEYIQAQLIYSALQLATALLKPGKPKDGNGEETTGGAFVAKIFRGRDIDLLYAQMGRLFEHVSCAKPRSSRSSSLESFIVCQGYRPREGWDPRAQLGFVESGKSTVLKQDNQDESKAISTMSTQEFSESTLESVPVLNVGDSLPSAEPITPTGDDDFYTYFEEPRVVAPFVACGDLSAYDSDATYTLEKGVKSISLDPVQKPMTPPYKRAVEMRRQGLIGRTKHN